MFDLSKHEMIKNCTKITSALFKNYTKKLRTWTVVIGKNEQFSIFAKHPLRFQKFIGYYKFLTKNLWAIFNDRTTKFWQPLYLVSCTQK